MMDLEQQLRSYSDWVMERVEPVSADAIISQQRTSHPTRVRRPLALTATTLIVPTVIVLSSSCSRWDQLVRLRLEYRVWLSLGCLRLFPWPRCRPCPLGDRPCPLVREREDFGLPREVRVHTLDHPRRRPRAAFFALTQGPCRSRRGQR